MILCDTNIFIEAYKNNKSIISELKEIGQENVATSQVTAAELVFGAFNKNELASIRSDLQKIVVIPVSNDISQRAFDLMVKYSLSHRLSLPDALIAATALNYDIPIYTLNMKDFKFITGLKLHK